MESIKFYCDNKPKIGEIVQVIFTNRDEDHASGYMIEYDCNVIMTYSQATKKKKIKSLNKVVPLNKELSATLEDYDVKTNTGTVSRAYLDDEVDYYEKIFKLNQKLYQGIYQICFKLKLDFNYLWKEKAYPFVQEHYSKDLEKYNYQENEKPSYFDIFVDHMEEFKSVLDNDTVYDEIFKRFEKLNLNNVTNKKRIGIISNDGVQKTKDLFNMCFDSMDDYDEIKDKIEISYSTPDFTIETKLPEEVLSTFVDLIVTKSKELGNMYVKVY